MRGERERDIYINRNSVFLRKVGACPRADGEAFASSPFSLASFGASCRKKLNGCSNRWSMNRAVSRYLARYRWLPGSCSVTPSVSVTLFSPARSQ